MREERIENKPVDETDHESLSHSQGYIPGDWLHIVEAKMRYYQSCADLKYAQEMRRDSIGQISEKTANARLSRARDVLSSALRSYRKDPRVTIPELETMLNTLLAEVTEALGGAENMCDREEWEALPLLLGESMNWSQPDCPYLDQAPPDLFDALGPLYFFNSLCVLTNKRTVTLERGPKGFGFTLKGNAPVNILEVTPNGPSALAGIVPGDYILELNGENVRACSHDDVVSKVRACSGTLQLTLIQNVDMQNFEELVGHIAPRASVDDSISRTKHESVQMDSIPIFGRLHAGSLSGKSAGSLEFVGSTEGSRKGSETFANAFA